MFDRRTFLLGSIGAGAAALGGPHLAEPAADPVRDLLKEAVGGAAKVAGMIAVTVDEAGTHTASYGSSGVPSVPLNGDTVFEIGSITKVFTALVLADMAERGEVAIDDPVAKYLPATVHLHEIGRPMTLLDLAAYTSGLPKLPSNLPPKWWDLPNPFAGYTEEELYESLSTYVPEYEPGAHYGYGNVGFALLGLALARHAGKSYEELVIDRVCNPLGLGHTRIAVSNDMRRHLASPHDIELKRTPLWDMQALQPAGAFRSSVKDATLFLKACMGLVQTRLQSRLARLLETRGHTCLTRTDAGLGWFISADEREEIVWKTGLTGGFNTFMGFSSRRRRGALVISNFLWAPIDVGTTNVGMKLINAGFRPEDLASLYR